ncbi:MAG: hypothetical protein ACKVOH_03225 [Chlamydiales bacterium]
MSVLQLFWFSTLLLFLSGCHRQKEEKPSDYLFVVYSDTATFVSSGDRSGRLKMQNLAPKVRYFAEKPEVILGTMSISDFMKNRKLEKSKAPVAGFLFYKDKGTLYAEIAVVVRNITWDEKSGTMEYEIDFIEPHALFGKKELNEAVLFIDDTGELYSKLQQMQQNNEI